ncbi:unnamed protein product [Ranitomeya imitator]|uniref:Tc1-like transposase DDE domain-containing protein n=1 Tax=Ranitomeya imitator TaxID=111125 RepID=A0ABN9MP95_9NEOB|nr:unnamed protein product [Ranitomeya imitator]
MSKPYQADIDDLRAHLLMKVRVVDRNVYLDNARSHVAGVCQQFLQDEGIAAMDWAAHSPDLNPIEHIWDIMSHTIHQRHIAPQTVQELADALVQVWEEIPQETICRLTRSMPRRRREAPYRENENLKCSEARKYQQGIIFLQIYWTVLLWVTMQFYVSRLLLMVTRAALKVSGVLFWVLVYVASLLAAASYVPDALRLIARKPFRAFYWEPRKSAPACLTSSAHGQHGHIRIKKSGIRFHYVASGEKGNPLMLLLHGFPENCLF